MIPYIEYEIFSPCDSREIKGSVKSRGTNLCFLFFLENRKVGKMMEIRDMRQLLGLSQQKFCDRYDIPLRTFQRWEKGDTPCPSYVKKLLERAVVQDAMTY